MCLCDAWKVELLALADVVSPAIGKAGICALLGFMVAQSGRQVVGQNGAHPEAKTRPYGGAQVGSGIGGLCRLMADVGGPVLTAVLVAQAG